MNQRLKEAIENDCKAIDTDQRYDDMLDEFYSFDAVVGLFAHMRASNVLQEVDPTAYRCGKKCRRWPGRRRET